ncbi:MAG: hypothetical protein SH820_15025 [Xanthomonadales bacterium]|nr:hypothetical protein [Xanthomonadales bacterium]
MVTGSLHISLPELIYDKRVFLAKPGQVHWSGQPTRPANQASQPGQLTRPVDQAS